MKFDFEKIMYIGCIPVEAHPTHPTDQSPCVIWDCRSCGKSMWVSEKKREYKKSHPNVEIYCLYCLAKAALEAGYYPEMQDITKCN